MGDSETLRGREWETVIQFAVDSLQLVVDSYQFSVEFEVTRYECD
jgi:hypothetical protein